MVCPIVNGDKGPPSVLTYSGVSWYATAETWKTTHVMSLLEAIEAAGKLGTEVYEGQFYNLWLVRTYQCFLWQTRTMWIIYVCCLSICTQSGNLDSVWEPWFTDTPMPWAHFMGRGGSNTELG